MSVCPLILISMNPDLSFLEQLMILCCQCCSSATRGPFQREALRVLLAYVSCPLFPRAYCHCLAGETSLPAGTCSGVSRHAWSMCFSMMSWDDLLAHEMSRVLGSWNPQPQVRKCGDRSHGFTKISCDFCDLCPLTQQIYYSQTIIFETITNLTRNFLKIAFFPAHFENTKCHKSYEK